jgi:peptide chain release factor subunit 1
VPAGAPKSSVEGLMEAALITKTLPEDLAKSLSESKTGGIVFWGPSHWYLIMPPFPITQESFSKTCEIEPLYGLLHREFLLGLVMVRMGEYGIAVYRGEKLLTSKVGKGVVHARHRQGGSSSHRFERHREKQMETFFTRVCEHAREQLEPFDRQLDYVLYGGTQETTQEFRKQCHYLQQFDKRTSARLLNVRQINQAGLAEGIREAWSSRVIQWKEK